MRTTLPTNSGHLEKKLETREADRNISRRTFLGISGATVMGSMAGCLNRVASTVTTTGASPAGAISARLAGFGDIPAADRGGNRGYDTHLSSVEDVPVTVRVGERYLSGEVELEGWLTTTTAKAQDYNTVRSNKRRSAFVPDEDSHSDDDVDGDRYLRLLELESHLLVQVETAIDEIDRQSDTDSRRALEAAVDHLDAIKTELDSCSSEVCLAVQTNADKRHQGIQQASSALESGDWESATEKLHTVREHILEDIDRLESELDTTVSETVDSVYAYLDGEPTVGERFSVSLPDAHLPRGGPSVADELTPRRLRQYLTGEAESCAVDADETVWCWGHNERVGFDTELREERIKRRGVAAYATADGVCVTAVSDDVDGTADLLALVPQRVDTDSSVTFEAVSHDLDTDDWGDELLEGDVSISPTFVCPIVARPEDAPASFYAVLYFTRCRHGDEYIYTGGWLIDDAALYEDSCTLLVAAEPAAIVAISPDDAQSEDAVRRTVQTIVRDTRRRGQGAFVYDGELDEAALEYIPDGFHDDSGLDGIISLLESASLAVRTGRNPQTGKEIQIPARDGPPASDDQTAMRGLITALDCPVLHLVDADGVGPTEKAKVFSTLIGSGDT